jgi:CheY-like chemotaxis protein
MRILIIDQNQGVRQQIINWIREYESSVEIETASKGYDGLIKARSTHFDLILTEINLPDLRGDLALAMLDYDCVKIGITDFFITPEIRGIFDTFLIKPIVRDNINLLLLQNSYLVLS